MLLREEGNTRGFECCFYRFRATTSFMLASPGTAATAAVSHADAVPWWPRRDSLYGCQLRRTPSRLGGVCISSKSVVCPSTVGIGRTEIAGRRGRASDRLRWVCSQIKRELAGKPAKWVLHTRVLSSSYCLPKTSSADTSETGFAAAKLCSGSGEQLCVCFHPAAYSQTFSTIDTRCLR